MPAVTPNAGAHGAKDPHGSLPSKSKTLVLFLVLFLLFHPLCLHSQPLQKLLQAKKLRGTALC